MFFLINDLRLQITDCCNQKSAIRNLNILYQNNPQSPIDKLMQHAIIIIVHCCPLKPGQTSTLTKESKRWLFKPTKRKTWAVYLAAPSHYFNAATGASIKLNRSLMNLQNSRAVNRFSSNSNKQSIPANLVIDALAAADTLMKVVPAIAELTIG